MTHHALAPRSRPRATLAPRQPCACVPQPGRVHQPCAACAAWDRGQVLLTDGTTLSRARWVRAHEVSGETIQRGESAIKQRKEPPDAHVAD